MSKTRRRLRCENARLRAEVARLQAKLKMATEYSFGAIVANGIPGTISPYLARPGPAIRRDPLGFWEMVEDQPGPPCNELFRGRTGVMKFTATGEPPTPPKKGDRILRSRPGGAEWREFDGEKWVTIKEYFAEWRERENE